MLAKARRALRHPSAPLRTGLSMLINLRYTPPFVGEAALRLAMGAFILATGCSDSAQAPNTNGPGSGGRAGASVADRGGLGGGPNRGGGGVRCASAPPAACPH